MVASWREALIGREKTLVWLLEHRGWTHEAIAELGVGAVPSDSLRPIRFPTRDAHGALTGFVAYTPVSASLQEGQRKSKAKGPRNLFPPPESIQVAKDEFVFVVEGEADAVVARSIGLPAVGIPGVQSWRRDWAERFAGPRVVICLDCDQQGRECAERVAADLQGVAADIRVLDLAPDRGDSYDLTDFVLGELGGDRFDRGFRSCQGTAARAGGDGAGDHRAGLGLELDRRGV